MRFRDIVTESHNIVTEAPADDIVATLQNINIDNVKRVNNSRVIVFVPRSERKATIKILLDRLVGASYDPSLPGSSVGGIRYAGGIILIKPAGGTGEKSAGLANEKHLVDTINRFVAEVGPLNVTFVDDNGKTITAKNVTQAISSGADVKGRKKSDVNLLSGNRTIPLSLKKSNAEYWESADTLWGARADQIVDRLQAEGKVKLTKLDKKRTTDGADFVKISPEVAVPASAQETIEVVFGSDILSGSGGVVKQTFEDEHYKLEGNNLTVTADLVITSLDDIPENKRVYWLIRNDSTRTRPKHKYPGLRVLASYASRINPNTLVVK